MFESIKAKIDLWAAKGENASSDSQVPQYTNFTGSLFDNITTFQGKFDSCADFICKEFVVCGNKAAVLMIDNMVDKVTLTESLMNPLVAAVPPAGVFTLDDKFVWLRDCVLSSVDEKEAFTFEDSISLLTAGFVIFLFDGVAKGLSLGIQGFKFRSIDEPAGEKVLRGSREGFIEALRINMAMVRRRIRNPNLKFHIFNIGSESRTDICVCYVKGIASESMVGEVVRRINNIEFQMVLASGNIQPLLSDHPYSIFNTMGYMKEESASSWTGPRFRLSCPICWWNTFRILTITP